MFYHEYHKSRKKVSNQVLCEYHYCFKVTGIGPNILIFREEKDNFSSPARALKLYYCRHHCHRDQIASCFLRAYSNYKQHSFQISIKIPLTLF